MMKKARYKGRLIDARVLTVRDGGWTAHFDIAENQGSETLDTHFETGQVFESEEIALETAIRLAVQKIDTGYTPVTVA
jgi:hypothetical protein